MNDTTELSWPAMTTWQTSTRQAFPPTAAERASGRGCERGVGGGVMYGPRWPVEVGRLRLPPPRARYSPSTGLRCARSRRMPCRSTTRRPAAGRAAPRTASRPHLQAAGRVWASPGGGGDGGARGAPATHQRAVDAVHVVGDGTARPRDGVAQRRQRRHPHDRADVCNMHRARAGLHHVAPPSGQT